MWVGAVFGAAGAAAVVAGEEETLEEGPAMMKPAQRENQLHLAILPLNTVAAHHSTMHHPHTQR